MIISRPPYNEKDLTSQPWQKWFVSVFSILTKFYTKKDVVIDESAVGLILKSPNGHYWRATVNNAGTIATTDLGTNLP